MNYRISDFCHQVKEESDNLVALYNALTMGIVIVDQQTAKAVDAAKGGVLTEDAAAAVLSETSLAALLKHKLIIPLGEQVDREDYLRIQRGLNCARIGLLYLLMTDACNLGCRYCFVENAIPAGYQFSMMSLDIAKKGIDLFSQSLVKNSGITEPQIILYGGEPLMNRQVLAETLTYIAEQKRTGILPAATSITLNTNGTLIDQEVANFLRPVENLNIAISLDGPAEIHNACRVYHGGRGSYDDIMKGFEILRLNGISAGFCCTISRYNVDQLLEIAKWFVEELGARSLGFNILIESKGAEQLRGDAEDYAQKAAQKIIECFCYFRRQGVYEDRIMRKVKAFVDGSVYYHDCGGCGQQLVVSPDGLVGVCQGYCGQKKYFVPMDDGFNPLSHQIWDEWRQRSPLAMNACKDCIALSVCGGGCPYSADLRHGSIWSLDDIFCVHAKATIQFLLQELIREAKTNSNS